MQRTLEKVPSGNKAIHDIYGSTKVGNLIMYIPKKLKERRKL